MTLTMADSITPANLPGGYDAYLGYVDGMWPTISAVRLRFPGARAVGLTVLGGDHIADGCDIENGDLSPTSGAAWIARRLAAGAARPVIYASVSIMSAVLGELTRLNIARAKVRLLSAHYGAGEHICGPVTCNLIYRVMDGTQWTDSAAGNGGSKIDASLLQNDFFGITPPPHPQEASVEISKTPPGNWEGAVVVLGKGADGNLWQTKTSDGKTWTEPVKQ